MKASYKNILYAFAAMAAVFLYSGCVERMEEDFLPETEYLSFKATLEDGSKSLVTKGHMGSFDFEEDDWVLSSEKLTKSSLLTSLDSLTAGVFGYVYDGEWSSNNSPLESLMDNHLYTFDTDQLVAATPVRWSQVEGYGADNFRVFAYAPKDKVVPTYETPATADSKAKGAPMIKIPDILAKSSSGKYMYQNDIVVADKVVPMNYADKSMHRKETPLDFRHIYTAIQFKAGFNCTIKSLTITGIQTGGNYVIGSKWELLDATGTYSMNIPDGGLNVSAGNNIGDLILMLPQPISSSAAKISLTYNDGTQDNALYASLNGVEWKQGKKITYTLIKDREYIYLDLAAGNIQINGKNYTGKVYVNGEAKTVTGEIKDNQKYYVYQSCATNESSPNYKLGFTEYDSNDKKASGVFTKPSYGVVTYKNMLWSDYITNNDNVEEVIEAWDNKTGATDNTGIEPNTAVRNVGRESTKNRIDVLGDVDNCVMILDNIYSSYHHTRGNRDYGSITFDPTEKSGSVLTLNLVGDNRLGCIQYDNPSKDKDDTINNYLVIEGEGSLTVADADFYQQNGYDTAAGGKYGYYSNHYDSAIGNADDRDNTYGIKINSGTIFAGTTAAENCSAIGGGGNGVGEVIINGGTVTAVASTTGTAIGGGIGYSSQGGKGLVTITGGNIYAYNHANPYGIPSSAIGGAGSSASTGTEGTVIITGGNVYALSGLGTAIGGGSSKTKHGGKGVVKISGGNIIAKSLTTTSTGIGGGSSYTGTYNPSSGHTKNGGDAEITISGNPIIRTGSIGGGSPGKGESQGGKIGNAKITISGGDIQAQFVMADSPNNTFEMSDGIIRNSATSDQEYYCIQENGGAVYMEKGQFTMTGGEIRSCSADKNSSSKGGAVYIEGDDKTIFTMSGGTIRECRANSDGGAVYLKTGIVEITGGTIQGNVAYDGNGGAISILGGNFTLNGDEASITENAAFGTGGKGHGGGIYVAPASATASDVIDVQLISGSISGNSADGNGGGICVDMGVNTTASLSVVVGEENSNLVASANPDITSNSASSKGGGMYVNGAKASVLLYDGNILYNGTSSYQVNPDITVDGGGVVTLSKSGITTQVTITFNDNAYYYTRGVKNDDVSKKQYVVTAAQSILDENIKYEFPNNFYPNFKGWATRKDAKEAEYIGGQAISFNDHIELFAVWGE